MLDYGVPEGLYMRVERMECPACGIGLREFSPVDSALSWLVAAECPACGALFEAPGTSAPRPHERSHRH